MSILSTEKTLHGRWVGVCLLAWTLSNVAAEEETISRHNLQSYGGDQMNLEGAVGRIFGVGESDSACDAAADETGCKCLNENCGCCLRLKVPKIHLAGDSCVNVSLLSEAIGLEVTFSYNGRVLFKRQVPVSYPQPFCVGVPVIKRAASVCIELYNLRRRNRTFCGCIKIRIRLALIQIFAVKIGCFGIPFGTGEEGERRADLMVRSFTDFFRQNESRLK